MKSINSRYKPPRIRNKIADLARRKGSLQKADVHGKQGWRKRP